MVTPHDDIDDDSTLAAYVNVMQMNNDGSSSTAKGPSNDAASHAETIDDSAIEYVNTGGGRRGWFDDTRICMV